MLYSIANDQKNYPHFNYLTEKPLFTYIYVLNKPFTTK